MAISRGIYVKNMTILVKKSLTPQRPCSAFQRLSAPKNEIDSAHQERQGLLHDFELSQAQAGDRAGSDQAGRDAAAAT
ncbi:MAG: hypothetical protein EB064_00470 [Betaproteobacteria bacterium]|nr:hypothetical protein [Betaproteobacteria bacterium]